MDDSYEIGHRLIVVVPDKTAEAMREAQAASEASDESFAAKIAKSVFSFYTEPFAITLGKQAIELIKTIMDALDKGADLTTLSYSESKSLKLEFPPGHPRENVVYAQHPANPLVYYTASSFHRQAFEHKFAEVITLLSSLGANEIKVEHVSGWDQDFSASLGISAPTQDSASAGVGKKGAEKSSVLFEAKLTGHDSPSIPENLTWYPHESLWQAVATARVNNGLKNFNLSLTYSDDYGLNASFKATVKGTGLDLGGKFEEHQATVWKITGTFGPASIQGVADV
ncbi:hypothetical protein ACOXVJ_09900 [Pseudomonas knackmussii]|uniref:Uncharacterized protein n=1 Tax=Pseudomonas panipatensis TaxID=428992 RepID=A0A1G8KSG7_9PSED|nr:hypothetical protein [Pseudomonas panipatensis]SDI46425.1 hypothetical protein SAMN05216272_109228 [Pseudomonas panipatensis]SMP70545.1 hypothetical protein SAMN06295951_109228 [Pseudomonas panipatensis]